VSKVKNIISMLGRMQAGRTAAGEIQEDKIAQIKFEKSSEIKESTVQLRSTLRVSTSFSRGFETPSMPGLETFLFSCIGLRPF
jgi:hypothetical protein